MPRKLAVNLANIDRDMLFKKAVELDEIIQKLVAMRDGLQHDALVNLLFTWSVRGFSD